MYSTHLFFGHALEGVNSGRAGAADDGVDVGRGLDVLLGVGVVAARGVGLAAASAEQPLLCEVARCVAEARVLHHATHWGNDLCLGCLVFFCGTRS